MRSRRHNAKILFRDARPADTPELLQLEQACFRSYYRVHRFSARQFRYYLRSRRTVARVAVRGVSLVGYVLGIVSSSGIARLHSVAVRQEAQHRGIGGRLLREFVQRAFRRRARRVVLEVAARNRSAQKIFERAGFVAVRRLRDYYGPDIPALRMMRERKGEKNGTVGPT